MVDYSLSHAELHVEPVRDLSDFNGADRTYRSESRTALAPCRQRRLFRLVVSSLQNSCTLSVPCNPMNSVKTSWTAACLEQAVRVLEMCELPLATSTLYSASISAAVARLSRRFLICFAFMGNCRARDGRFARACVWRPKRCFIVSDCATAIRSYVSSSDYPTSTATTLPYARFVLMNSRPS